MIRGAEVGSEHYLVLLKVRLQVETEKMCRSRKKQVEGAQTRELRDKVEASTRTKQEV